MALSDLLLNKTSTPGLWFVKSRNISEDIAKSYMTWRSAERCFLKFTCQTRSE